MIATVEGDAVDVVVVGAGIGGLVTARHLAAAGMTVRVLEARARVGGRTKSIAGPDGRGRFELGASWLWQQQTELIDLVSALGLELREQHETGTGLYDHALHLPPRDIGQSRIGSLRIAEGSQALAERLAAELPPTTVRLGCRVTDVDLRGRDAARVIAARAGAVEQHIARIAVVLALPPQLAAVVQVDPPPSAELQAQLRRTPTWMGDTYKVVVGYESSFWHTDGRSGLAISHVGPLREVHDAGSDGAFALLGMADVAAHDLRAMDVSTRRRAVIGQLQRIFGPKAAAPSFVFEHDWSAEPEPVGGHADQAAGPYGHPALASSSHGGRLLFASAEGASVSSGQMHGAVLVGAQAASRLLG